MFEEADDRIIRETECRYLTSLSRSFRFKLEAEGRFPRRVYIAHGICGWRLSDVQKWIKELPAVANDDDFEYH